MEKKTLFELWKSKKEQKELNTEIDCPLANPFDLKFNSLIDIKTDALYDIPFKLDAIEEYRRGTNGEVFTFTDYTLEGSLDEPVKLRCVDDDVLVLTQYHDTAYSDELNDVLNDTERTGIFEITEGEEVLSYSRVNNIKRHWDASVKKLIDADHNGRITKLDPVIERKIKYWDFRNDSDFIFVEMDKETGWITMWRGNFVDPQSVIII